MARRISIILVDDDPNAVKILETEDWRGKAFVIPRGKLSAIKERSEQINEYPGLYYLFGDSEDGTQKVAYVGEAEQCYKRLMQHDAGEKTWDLAIVFIGQDLNSAGIEYLENKSYTLALGAGRYPLMNKERPADRKVSEGDKIVWDKFLEKISLILGVLGFPIFQPVAKIQEAKEIYHIKTGYAVAQGNLLDNGEFVVYKDSIAQVRETPSFEGSSYQTLRRKLETDRVLERLDEDRMKFTKDYIFSKPSAAANVVAGRYVNGWTTWKDETGRTLDEVKRG